MATRVTVLRGNLAVGTDVNDYVDVGDEVFAFSIMAERGDVEIPATLNNPVTHRAGSAKYSLQIDFNVNEGYGPGKPLFELLWGAIGSPTGTLYFRGQPNDGAASSSNEVWSGYFVATGAKIGGNVDEAMTDSQTFPMLDRPSRNPVDVS